MDTDAIGLPGAQRVALLRVLDLDYFGAEIGELQAYHIARYEPRHVDDPYPSSGHAARGSKDFSAMLISSTAPGRLPERINVVGLAFGHAAARLAQACDTTGRKSD